jgi:hypothetical protein
MQIHTMEINKETQDRFFAELGASLTQPASVYVFDGTSLICLPMPNRLTDDIDAFSAGDAVLRESLQTQAGRMGWKVDDLDVSEISETPAALAYPPVVYRQFGFLSVMIVDPNLTAVGKLDRGGEGDIRDLKWMLAENLLDLGLMEALIHGARNMDDKGRSIRLFNQLSGRRMDH